MSSPRARANSERLAAPADLAHEADALAIDVGGDLSVKERLLSGLDHTRQHQRYINGASGGDRAVRPLLRGHPSDPEQVVALALLQRPGPQVDRVRDRIDRTQSGRCRCELGPADPHQRRLVPVAGVERRGVGGERPVQRVHERCVDAVCHREPGEAAVVVNDVEAITIGGAVDRIERPADMVDLKQRALDLVGMGARRAESRRSRATRNLERRTASPRGRGATSASVRVLTTDSTPPYPGAGTEIHGGASIAIRSGSSGRTVQARRRNRSTGCAAGARPSQRLTMRPPCRRCTSQLPSTLLACLSGRALTRQRGQERTGRAHDRQTGEGTRWTVPPYHAVLKSECGGRNMVMSWCAQRALALLASRATLSARRAESRLANGHRTKIPQARAQARRHAGVDGVPHR